MPRDARARTPARAAAAAAPRAPLVPAVAKAVAIVRLLNGRSTAGASLAEVSQALSITRSHCYNILRALAGPFPEVSFCPTGGVTLANAAEYLALPNVRCVGGSWVVPAQALAAQDWDQITALAAQAVALRA